MKVIILLISAVFSFGAFAQSPNSPPPDFRSFTVPMLLHCVSSMTRMEEVLAKTHFEAPVALMQLSPNTSAVIFTNEESTTSTIVIDRNSGGERMACVIWSGKSSIPGGAFLLNPEPKFPQKGPDGVGA